MPLVAETSSDTKDPSERNLYYALSEGGAIGYDLWAIDTAYGLGAWEQGYGLAGHDFVLNMEGLTGEVTALAGGWSGYHFVPDGGHVQAEHHDGVVSISMPRPAVVRLRWDLVCESQGVTEE